MAQSRGSVDNGEETEDVQEAPKPTQGTSIRKADDDVDCRKSQAQRLLEFEMWRNDETLRDLEYSQRRSEKKQRHKKRRRDYQKQCWKKLYLPAVLGMLTGMFLTFCATLQSLAGDTFLWNARGIFVILGPIMLGMGLVSLMLAAGCTFKHDQEARQKPVGPPPEFRLREFEFQYSRPSTALRSVSVDSADLPLPDDLDLTRNYVVGKSGWSQSRRKSRTITVSRDDSVNSGGFLMLENSSSSTASWIQLVSAAHNQQFRTLTRQNSDSNLLLSSANSERLQEARQYLLDSSQCQDHNGSRSDLNVVCTRSLTSSGYQSASDSTSGTAENRLSCENGQRILNFSGYTPLRHPTHCSTSHMLVKSPVRDPKMAQKNRHTVNEIYQDSVDSGLRILNSPALLGRHKH